MNEWSGFSKNESVAEFGEKKNEIGKRLLKNEGSHLIFLWILKIF